MSNLKVAGNGEPGSGPSLRLFTKLLYLQPEGDDTTAENMSDTPVELCHRKHAKYFLRFLGLLPPRLASHDSTRITIGFFAVSGLDVLNSLDFLTEENVKDVIDWVYSYQVVPKPDQPPCGGIMGSGMLNVKEVENSHLDDYKWGHLAMTYTGIAILVALGDDLSRLNKKAIIEGVAAVQREDGSFCASIEGSEHDMRFVYCAAAVCAMLDDWTGVDRKAMANYILSSIRYDYGVSQHYEMESHGGTTFCALAALELSNQLDVLKPDVVEGMRRWLVFRQVDGFQGRPNKPVDTCYSFWIGAALKILDSFDLTDFEENRKYVMSTQDSVVGGFSKWPGSETDPFHTYFGLCGLSFIGEPGLEEVMPSLNISMRAYKKLKKLHEIWKLPAELDKQVKIDIE